MFTPSKCFAFIASLVLMGLALTSGADLVHAGPEPAGWYAGDMHVHRSCGGPPESVSSLYSKMSPQNLAFISLLADMGNGEVQNPTTDLPLVNGQDASVSTPGRIVHWDAEWHWDATYNEYPHQALGGHVVALGLTEAHQIWQEYTYPIFDWAHQQNAIAGFVHMQHMDDDIPQSLNCCIPIEYPVEVALGSADFIAEDVEGGEPAIQGYYRLLNCGFRPGFAAGTDYPCGVSELGSLLTYVQVAGGEMTYRNWIEGIANGRTVISRNGHKEFLNLVVNGSATPGDEINLASAGNVSVTITWTAIQNLTGTIELVRNGVVVARQHASVSEGSPATLSTTVNFAKSGWLAARRMESDEHVIHTGAVFMTVNGAPVRASVKDANFYVQWIDNLLTKTSPGGEWNSYFPTQLAEAQARYQAAKAIYQQIALEASGQPPDEGPGGPILVISSSSNPFSRYYAEILRAEGFNNFAVRDISLITGETLSDYDVAVLGEMALTDSQVAMFTNWVNGGGNLIAMHPDKKLAPLLGLTDTGSILPNAYLLVNTTSGPAKGIVNQTIQFHGHADRYGLSGASSLATLYSNATTPTSYPAVTLLSVGENGGQAAAFTYDLAKSVVYTRQGNPAWSGQERDDISPIRSDDLFYPDWVDLNKVAIPQADEQQRLLANLIIQMNFDKKPLPRFWYFPRGLKAAVIMTGDNHGSSENAAARFESYKDASRPGCSVQDWECIRATAYIYTDEQMTPTQAAAYDDEGFEIGLHVTTGCANFTPSSLESYFSDQLADWSGYYSNLPPPVTNRTHCIAWSDYDTQPQVELAHGIRLDTNYYYWPPEWINDRPGFFTGSGMPMRFAKSDGTMIDVYQATTQMTDESWQTYPFTIDQLLDKAIGQEGYYGAFTANIHTDSAYSDDSDEIIASAQTRRIPVVSARQMLQWLDGRNSSSFSNLTWNGTALSFTVSAGQGANGLTAMVPIPAGMEVASITRNGSQLAYSADESFNSSNYWVKVVKGINYAFFSGISGSYQINLTTPTISGNAGVAGATLSYTDGTPKTATADGSGNYSFTVSYNWSGTVTPSKSGYTFSPTSRSYSSVVSDQTGQNYTATLQTFTLTYTAGANGSISGASPQTVSYGGSGTAVTAVPAAHYHFVQWSDGLTANPRTDTNVTANITVSASFAIDTFTLTYTAGANGSISGASPQTVSYGGSGTAVTAVPAAHYHFVQWSGGLTANPRTDTNVTANITVSASFAIDTFTLAYTAGANGSISGASPQTVSYGGSGTAVTAVPAAHYHFVQWSDGLTANPRTDTNVTANITVSASFAIDTYQVTANGTGNGAGSVSSSPAGISYNYSGTPTSGSASFNHGTQVVLTAGAGVGSVASWGGTCTAAGGIVAGNGETSATCTFGSLDGTKTVGAIFTYNTTISKPTTPKGPKTGVTGKTYTYTTGGSVVGSGDPVEYQFDLNGDGSTDLSSWGSAKQSKTWVIADSTYNVRARARSAINPYFISEWSDALAVSVTEKPFIHVTSPNGGETWVVGATHPITWNSNYLDPSGRIYLFYWYGGAWHPITDFEASSETDFSYDWTIPLMPSPVSGSEVPASHVSKTSIYIGNWVNGAWQCWDTNDKGFKILDDGWVFKISGGDKGGAALWINTDESSFDGYGLSFNLRMFKIQGVYTVDAKGVIRGEYQLTDFASGDPLPDGNGSMAGSVNSNATKLKMTLRDQGNVVVFSMSGAWLGELTMPEDWSVQISGSVKGTMDSLTILAHQDLNEEVYANLFDLSGSGLLADGVTSISMKGRFFFIPAKTVYGIYDQLTIGGNSPEDGIFSGTLDPSTGKFTFKLTSSNGNKYTFVGVKAATP